MEVPTSQIAGCWESTRDKLYSHKNPNIRVLQPLFDPRIIPGRWIKGNNKMWKIFWITWTRIVGDITWCHTSKSFKLLLIYTRFELNIKCLWQYPASSKDLEITRIEWGEVFDPIVTTAHSLRQRQPGNWKIPSKPRTEELTNLLSALEDFAKLPHFKNTHLLTRHLVKELNRQCQFSVSDDQATGPECNKTNYN